jgi:hypothetical protein
MDLGDGGELAGSIRPIEERLFVAQRNPKASQTAQDNAALGIGNKLNGAVAFSCLAPWIHP